MTSTQDARMQRGDVGPAVGTDPVDSVVVAAALASSEAVVMLRVFGSDLELTMDPDTARFTLGSSPATADSVVPFKHVSRVHAVLERDHEWLKVVNRSQNRTYFDGSPFDAHPVSPGDRFTVATTELLALDGPRIVLRRMLGRYLGFDAHRRIDQALIDIAGAQQSAVLITGPRGSEPERLARAIHVTSARRDQPFEVLAHPDARSREIAESVARAGSGTVFVDVGNLRGTKASAALVNALFGPGRAVRTIVAAPSARAARAALDWPAEELKTIEVPAVKDWPGDVERLLDMLLAELGSTRRLEHLAPERRAAVCGFDWTLNYADLRENAHRLKAYLEHGGNLSAAARAIGRDTTTLRTALLRIGAIGRSS